MDLGRLLAPRSVAVVGASDRPGSYGGEALLNLSRVGFPGRVYAVNPRRASVHGVRCHAALEDLPEAPDAVVVAIPAAGAPAVVEAVGAIGGGGAVVFAAGFAEMAEGGAKLQGALAEAARRHDLPVCGPNGNGIVALHDHVALWGDAVGPREPGPVALVSQSGNVAVNALAARRGLRLHTVVSCGNQAVLGAAEFLAALAQRDGVRAVALYLEDDGDGEGWCAALERCARAGVGVAVLKAGSSRAGAAAARAHTGAVAGDQRVIRALFEEAGAAWAEDPHDLLELAKALSVTGARGAGRRLAVMTCSGGDSSVAADHAEALGVPLPELAPETVERLRTVLPAAATPANPLDYTALLWNDPQALRALLLTLADDPGVDQLLVLYDQAAGADGAATETWGAVLEAVRSAAVDSASPVAVAATLPELLSDADAAGLQAQGTPALGGLRTGMRCVRALGAPAADPVRVAEIGAAARRAGGGPHGAWLAEHEATALLREAGVPVLDGRTAPEGVELLVAARGDGLVPVLAVGLGGVWTEALDDVALVPLPVAPARVERALLGLRGAALLRGARGRAPVDVGAVARLASTVGALLLDRGLDRLELNPVIAYEAGAVAVDALARLGCEGER
jgi:acetyl-CoA synthetase